MEFGISNLAIVPIRAQGSERSEQVSQLLFGEAFEIMEQTEGWTRIITAFDGYEGWVNRIQYAALNEVDYKEYTANSAALTSAAVTQVFKQADGTSLLLPVASSLPFLEADICRINNDQFRITSQIDAVKDIESTARTYLNTPYLWGGRTHFGIDCSGFVQSVFRQHGVNIKRDASMQAEQGTLVDFLQEAKLGDLAFFDNAEGRITHVGLMLGNEQVIHASGKVKIDRIDNQGIYSEELKKYTHKLRIIKRFL